MCNAIDLQTAPTYLGVKLDRTLTYRQHRECLKAKTTSRVALIRRLAGTTWGAATKTLRISTQALVYSAAEYCAHVWCRSSHTKQLDTVLNSAMRTVAGCLRPTPVNQLPILAGIAPPTIRREAAVLALTRKAAKDEDHILHLVISERPSPARLKSRRPFAEHAHRLLRSTPEDVSSRSWLSTRWNEEWRAAEHSRLHSFINTPDHVPGQDLPRRQWTTYNRIRTGVGRFSEAMVLVLKQCGDGIIPSMTSIINMSLESGVVPRCFKKALVRPLLKKPSLDAECLKNYRPVSNLSFISKQTERVVAARLNEHMSQFELFEPLQSAYKVRHSCETALIHVQNNILCAMDQGKVGILLLLDMSAAFETVDHITLLDRLHTELGIGGTALDWFESYLVDRHQVVAIGGEHSDSHLLRYGVPQGSVLGPQLFTVYTSPLGRIIRAHGLEYHLFADDSQLYVFVKPVEANVDGAIGRLEKCCHDISTWMRRNFLKLNDDKTEVLLIGSRQQLSKIALPGVTVGESLIAPATVVRDLGAVFDTHMTMVPHVNALSQSARYHIRNIGKIRRFLDRDSCEKIVHAFVTSRLDLNNALLAGLPGDTVAKLQKCQNIAARVVTRTRIRDHIKPVLMNLHWLPVEQRIQYKLLIQVYKALNGLAPEYIADLLQ